MCYTLLCKSKPMKVCTYKRERQYSCLLVKWFSPTQSSSWKTKQAQSQLINKRCLIKPVLFWGSEILHVYFLLLKQQWYIIYYFTAFFKNDADLWWMLCHTIRTNLNLMSRSYTVQICIICNIYNQFFIWLHFLINKALYWLCALWVVWFSKFYSGPKKNNNNNTQARKFAHAYQACSVLYNSKIFHVNL